jgi:hypothetical protein
MELTYIVTARTTLRAGQSEATPLMAWLRQGAVIRGTPYRAWVKVTEINGYEAWGYTRAEKLKEVVAYAEGEGEAS